MQEKTDKEKIKRLELFITAAALIIAGFAVTGGAVVLACFLFDVELYTPTFYLLIGAVLSLGTVFSSYMIKDVIKWKKMKN